MNERGTDTPGNTSSRDGVTRAETVIPEQEGNPTPSLPNRRGRPKPSFPSSKGLPSRHSRAGGNRFLPFPRTSTSDPRLRGDDEQKLRKNWRPEARIHGVDVGIVGEGRAA